MFFFTNLGYLNSSKAPVQIRFFLLFLNECQWQVHPWWIRQIKYENHLFSLTNHMTLLTSCCWQCVERVSKNVQLKNSDKTWIAHYRNQGPTPQTCHTQPLGTHPFWIHKHYWRLASKLGYSFTYDRIVKFKVYLIFMCQHFGQPGTSYYFSS